MNQATPTVPSHVPRERVIHFDAARDPALAYDVFKRLDEIRQSAPPIAFTPHNGGHWMIFEREDIQTVLTSPEYFTSTHISAGSIAQGGPPMIPLGMGTHTLAHGDDEIPRPEPYSSSGGVHS